MKLENILARKDIPEDVKEAIRVGINSTIEELNSQKIKLEMQNEELRKARQYLDIAGVIVLVINADQTIALINQKGSEILGYEISECIGKNWFDTFIHEKNRARIKSIFNELISGTIEPFKYVEDSLLTKSGEERIIVWHNTVIRDNSGKIISTLSSGEDITKRKEAEEALHVSLIKYQTLFESFPLGITVSDKAGKIVETNQIAEKLLGITKEEHIQREINSPVWKTVRPDGTSMPAEEYASVRALKENRLIENQEAGIVKTQGEITWINVTAAPLDLPEYGVVVTYGDVTERKRAEQEVRKLSLAVEQSPSAVMITNREGNIEYVNPKFTKVSGYEREEVMGKNPRFLKSGKTLQEEYKQMWNIIKLGGEWRGEFHNVKKNGELYWESALIAPIRNEDGAITHFLALKEDITRQKKTEELLNQSEKMAAIGTLAAGIAHEINNPIGYILSNLKYMMKYNEKLSNYHEIVKEVIDRYSKGKLREASNSAAAITQTQQDLNFDYILTDMKNAISESLEGAEKIKKIVSDLKDFSRVGKPQIKYSNLNEGIEKALGIIWNELKYKSEVVKEFGEIPEIECDLQQLQQVVLNLSLNAAQSIEKKGVIKITTSQKDNWIVIKISDTGKGIPENIRDNIFEAFFTTKEPGKGTGLGLSVAYRIIRAHGGTITFESEVGKGTTFIIRLPIKYSEPVNEKKVLIVDDDKSIINILIMMVNKYDKSIIVNSVFNGSEALNLAATFKPDVILTDIVMPGMNGFELCKKIKETELKDKIKIVMFSGYEEEGLKEKCLEAGAVEYLTKPIQVGQIFRILDRVLND